MKKEKQNSSGQQDLRRGIKSWQIALIGTGGVVGSCYFLGLGPLIHDMGPSVLLAYLGVALIVYGMMLSYAELLVNLPQKGSFVSYTKEFLGQTAAVGIGWAFWFNWICYVPSETIGVAVVINTFFPGNQMAYAIGVLFLLTAINLCTVDVFAKVESALAILKICIIVLFCVIGLSIWIGLWGNRGFLGSSVNFGGTLINDLFPNGAVVVLTSMVVVLVNFQGIEILGLAVSETQNAETAVPKPCKTATYMIMGMYLIPILVILGIFPTDLASLDGAIFAQTLTYYHLDFWAALLSGAVMFASFSCANTGLYGTVRCLYGLACEGLAPKIFSRLDRHGSPRSAVLFSLLSMWVVLMLGLSSGGSNLYQNLLSVAGFTGAAAWMGIIVCQLQFRRRLIKNGYEPEQCLQAAVPRKQKWITLYALIAQGIALVMLAFGEGQQIVFFIACMAIMVPALISLFFRRRSKAVPDNLGDNEWSFSAKFPPKK